MDELKETKNEAEGIKITIPKKLELKKNHLFILGGIVVLILVFFLVKNRSSEVGEKGLVSIYQEINQSVYLSEILSSDQYNAWHYGIYEKNHYKSDVASKTTLSSSDLNNSYCSAMTYKNDWEYVVYCVNTAHEEKGDFKRVKSLLDGAKEKLNKLNDQSEKVKNLKKYYQAALSFYNLANDYDGSFSQYQVDIKDMRNKMEDFQNELDLEFNYDHTSDKVTFQSSSGSL